MLLLLFLLGTCQALHSTQAAKEDQILNLPGLGYKINFEQYAGFINVDTQHNRNLFYWFVQSQGNPAKDPLVIWLTGGPGCSSLLALFSELGPFRPDEKGQLYRNPFAWNNNSNVIFLESPAGVGFSYSGDVSDYDVGDARTAADEVAFLEGFLQRYPEFYGRDFWVTGESYGGHYTVELVVAIMNAQANGRLKGLHLRGHAVGNAWTDPPSDNRGAVETWWNRALISDEVYQCAIATCDFSKIGPLVEQPLDCDSCLNQASASFDRINIYDIYVDVCLSGEEENEAGFYAVSQLAKAGSLTHRVLEKVLQRQQQQNRKRSVNPPYVPCIGNYISSYLRTPAVIRAIHATASPLKWSQCSPVVNYSYKDVLTSVVPLYHQLLNNNTSTIKIYVYSGDVDAIVPYWGTREWISKLGIPVTNPWRAWQTADGQVGGFVQEYMGGKFTFVTVRDAGHMVPQFQPQRAAHMFRAILQNKPL